MKNVVMFVIRFAAGWYLGSELAKMVQRTEMAELSAQVAFRQSEKLMKENDELIKLVEDHAGAFENILPWMDKVNDHLLSSSCGGS